MLASLWLTAAMTLTACNEQVIEAVEPVSRPVKLFTVGEDPSGRTLQFPGSVSAAQHADMAFEVAGRVADIPVTVGDLVKAGTVLARLDPRDYEAQRDQARAERNLAQAEFNLYDRGFRRQAVTAQELDRARGNLQVAEANLRRADKAVEDTVLSAPFAGRVARKLVDDFANVQAKQPVLILQSDDALEMRVHVPEALWVRSQRAESVAEIELDYQISVVLSALPGESMPAWITAFDSMADPVTRTFKVRLGFEPPEGLAVSPGVTGHVAYEVPPELAAPGLLIPAAAVAATSDNTPYVWLYDAEAGTVTQRDITIAEPTGDRLRVRAGLEMGDRIAVSGVHTLSEGFLVHALED